MSELSFFVENIKLVSKLVDLNLNEYERLSNVILRHKVK
jgi:hypothetical protein